MLWGILGMARQASELAEEISEKQRERIRKEGRKVTDQEVYQKACEELDEAVIIAEEKAAFRKGVRDILAHSREQTRRR